MRTLLLMIMIAFCVSACKKGDEPSSDLYGKWELHRQYGGFMGKDSIYAAGNGNIYQFNRGNTYKHFTNGTADAQGVFVIKKYGSQPDQPANHILFDNITSGEPISIDGNKLSIGTTVTDGQISEYTRIQN